MQCYKFQKLPYFYTLAAMLNLQLVCIFSLSKGRTPLCVSPRLFGVNNFQLYQSVDADLKSMQSLILDYYKMGLKGIQQKHRYLPSYHHHVLKIVIEKLNLSIADCENVD